MSITSEPELTVPEGLTPLEVKMVGEIDQELMKLRKTFEQPLAQHDRLMVTRQNLLAGERGTAVAVAGRSTRRGGSSAPSNGGGSQGKRQEAFLKIVARNPGINIPRIAEIMNESLAPGEKEVQTNYLYRVRNKMTAAGRIHTDPDGKELHPGPAPDGAGA